MFLNNGIARTEDLSKLDTLLVETVDSPQSTLAEDLVLVHGDKRA